MSGLFRFTKAVRSDEAIDEWLSSEPYSLFVIARHWFAVFRRCGEDVNELMHDGCPTACVQDAAFGYVKVCRAHVNVGFFSGADLPDPHNLLEGTGKRMRHVKVLPGGKVNSHALEEIIGNAYKDVKARL